MIEYITDRIRRIEENLLGTYRCMNEGPWKANSTSPGANRWNIIRCDCERIERLLLKQILDIINKEKEN